MEAPGEQGDGHETDGRDHRQDGREPHQQGEHHREGGGVDDQEDEAEADEAADGGDIGRGPGEELTRLPAVMKGHRETLKMGVEGVAQTRLEAKGGEGQHVASEEGHGRFDDAEAQGEGGEDDDARPAVLGHRPVHHPLGDEGNEGADDQAQEGRNGHQRQLSDVRADVGTKAPERDVVQRDTPRDERADDGTANRRSRSCEFRRGRRYGRMREHGVNVCRAPGNNP